nr:uncharacterized protein LOC129383936 [Dermacentor andersoni]
MAQAATRRPLGPHVSPRQRTLLVEFMEQHPWLVKGSSVLTPEVTKASKARLWRELAEILNAEGPAMKTADQWRQFWKKEVYNSRHDAAVVAAEHRGTGGGRLCGLRGRILDLVGHSSAVGVCDGFFEEDSTLPSSAQSLDGRAPSPQLTPTTAVQPVTAPADQATPRGRRYPSRVSVGDQPGTSGLSRKFSNAHDSPPVISSFPIACHSINRYLMIRSRLHR